MTNKKNELFCFSLQILKRKIYKISKSKIKSTRANRAPKISKNVVSYVYKLSAPILVTAKTTLRQKMKFVKIFVRDKNNRLASSKVRRKVWENATTRYQQSKLYLSLFTQAQH